MSTNIENAHAIFKSAEGKELGVGEWQEITQERINQFAEATLDHQFIHTDPPAPQSLRLTRSPLLTGS